MKGHSKRLLGKFSFFFIALFGIFVNFAFAVDYTDRLPSTITLVGGTSQTSKAIANCSSYWECVFGQGANVGYDFTYSTSGNGASTLTLHWTLPQNPTSQKTTTPFYMGNTTINPNSNLVINGFSSILLEYKMSLNNSSLTFNADTTTTTAFTLFSNASVALTNNANLAVNVTSFTNNNIVTINNSKLTITANSTHSYKELTNSGGTLTINGNFFNVGQKKTVATTESSVANFTNTDATTIITGSVLNGGQIYTNSDCRTQGICGGGNIIIKGGSVKVSGTLISEGKDGQASTIQIYGGTLVVGNTLQNKQGSTLTFGLLNGVMGQLQGNLANSSGIVNVDLTSVNVGQSYTIITGTASGLDGGAPTFLNLNELLSATYADGKVTVSIKGGDSGGGGGLGGESGGKNALDSFKEGLNSNEQGILNATMQEKANFLTSFASTSELKTALADTDKALKNAAVTQPKSIINAFRGDALLAPIQSTFVARRLAAASNVRLDSGRRVRALREKPSRDFYVAPVGALLRAEGTSGYVAGFTLGSDYKMGALTNRIYAAYAYGAARQDLATQSSDTTAHLLQLGTLNRYSQGIWELDVNANFLFGAFSVDNVWQQAPTLNSTSKFNNYQLNLGLLAGARFGKTLSIKPFVGVQNYAEMQSAFKSILGFEAQGYKAYVLDGVVGVEGHYFFAKNAAAYGKIGFENRLYNSHKHLFLRTASSEISYENKAYNNAISVNLGAQLFAWGRFKLNLEGAFKRYDSGLNYFGGNLGFRYGMR